MWKRKSRSSGKGGQGPRKRARVAGGRYWGTRSGTWRGRQGSFLTDQTGPSYSAFTAGRSFVKFRSQTTYALSGTNGAFTVAKALKLNSIFDPFGTTGALTATGYTNYLSAGTYQSYQVQSFWLRLTIVNNNATVPVNFGANPEANSTVAATTFTRLAARRMAKSVVVSGATGGPAVRSIVIKGSMAQVVGDYKDSILIDDTYSALAGTDPATVIVCSVGGQAMDAATSWGVLVKADLIQCCMLFGPAHPLDQ